MTTPLARLRAVNPAAVGLARVCALAARVEPDLLRRLRLLVPGADASTEADLWFSEVLAGRDGTAIALDPAVADELRGELRAADRAWLREAAWALISAAHAGAHWSLRLEEQVNYLDVARPPGAAARIDDLLMAPMAELDPGRPGIARFIRGRHRRQPAAVQGLLTARAAAAAATLHLDRQAPDPGLLSAEETQAWLPWLAGSLPRVEVPVRLMAGAVVLGAGGPDSLRIPGVPDTDPLVIEVRWNDGTRDRGRVVRLRPRERVHIETGTASATFVTLDGGTYTIEPADAPDQPVGPRFDHLKARLRPCLARDGDISMLAAALTSADYDVTCAAITGRPGRGKSTLLVAVADELAARGVALVEHFRTPADQPDAAQLSCLTQLAALYRLPTPAGDVASKLSALSTQDTFARRPLVIVLDGLTADDQRWFPAVPPPGVRYLLASTEPGWVNEHFGAPFVLVDNREADRQVCLALAGTHTGQPIPPDTLADLADDLPANLVRLLGWLRRQPPGTVGSVPAILTSRWPATRRALAARFRGLDVLLDLVRAADGRNSWQDCAEAAAASRSVQTGAWPDFWRAAVAESLVLDVPPTGLVRLGDPAFAELLAVDPAGTAHRLLGPGYEPDPAAFARTASTTRLAAAVGHALAAGEPAWARELCTDLTALRRRYAEDATGLLADLDTVRASRTPAPAARDSEPDAAALGTLRNAVRALAARQVPPAGFAAALHDRLAEYAAVDVVPGLAGSAAPLRVRAVRDEPDLRAGTSDHMPGPVLAVVPLPLVEPLPLPLAEPLLVRPTGLVSWAGLPIGEPPPPELLGGVSADGGCVAWTRDDLYASEQTGRLVRLALVGARSGAASRIHAFRGGLVEAAPDGAITLWQSGKGGWRSRGLVGHGAEVTAAAAVDGSRVLTASADGTIRAWYPDSPVPQVYRGHRGAVRCLVATGPDSWVSGGDDGCLLSWTLTVPGSPLRRWRAHDAPVTCLADFPDVGVVSGAADGSVALWDRRTSSTIERRIPLGSHDEPVCGVAVFARGGAVASWASTVQFWFDRPGGRFGAAGSIGGFPGGVRDLVAGQAAYTVLCGDGSVRHRLVPDGPSGADPHPERGALAVLDGTVCFGVHDLLCALTPDGELRTVAERAARFVRAAVAGPGLLAVRDGGGAVSVLPARPAGSGSASPDAASLELLGGEDPIGVEMGSGDLLAANGSGQVALARGRQAAIAGQLVGIGEVRLATPAEVTSLALTPDLTLIAGLASGDTHLAGASRGPVRVLPGDGSAVTAVAWLPGAGVVTGSATGTVRWWPAGTGSGPTSSGPTGGVRHDGPVSAILAVPPWVVTAGRDGRLALWDIATARPVHEIDLGAPILALAGEPGLVAARDGGGRLWTFDCDLPGPGWTEDVVPRVSGLEAPQ